MTLIQKLNTFISFKIIGRKRTRGLIEKLSNSVSLNLLDIAHHEMGIASYGSFSEKSEAFVIEKYLKEYFNGQKSKDLIFFDIGANVGNYSQSLYNQFRDATIFSFEPNPASFEKIYKRFLSIHNIKVVQAGLGSVASVLSLYSYNTDKASEHASVYKNVMEDLHQSKDLVAFEVDIVTLDAYCTENNILQIDFLKIDTEGFELEVLKGASQLIMENKIKIIQFEFNEMNVYSRVFLKDFYTILKNYTFYRLMENDLKPMGFYNPKNEIFRYQNILAISND
ncbi:MAG: FkbM family methyltransferase [Ginsengibacter sp.]